MTFSRFAQIGRVVLIERGTDAGKLAVIIDIVDENRAFVDGPCSGVARQVINFKSVTLTDITISIPRRLRHKKLAKAYTAAEVEAKWAKTGYAKRRIARDKKASLGDFERFVGFVNRAQRRDAMLAKRKAIKA